MTRMDKLASLVVHVGSIARAAARMQFNLIRDMVHELLYFSFPVEPEAEGWVRVPPERWRDRERPVGEADMTMVLTHERGEWVRMETDPGECTFEQRRADMERFMERVS